MIFTVLARVIDYLATVKRDVTNNDDLFIITAIQIVKQLAAHATYANNIGEDLITSDE